MPKARTPRSTKPKAEKKVLQMPEISASDGAQALADNLDGEIRNRAYEIYATRGYTNGRAEQDWLEAEREVMARRNNAQSA